jgi:DNA-binding NtrC family response regulator
MRLYVASAVAGRARVREHPGVRSALRYDGPVPSVIFYDTHGGLEPPSSVVVNFLMRFPTAAIVVLAGHADVHEAVEAVRAGAFGYLLRPFSPDEVEVLWERAVQFHRFLESGAAADPSRGEAMRRPT